MVFAPRYTNEVTKLEIASVFETGNPKSVIQVKRYLVNRKVCISYVVVFWMVNLLVAGDTALRTQGRLPRPRL